jgi:plasmid replication initiation protein
VGLDFTQPNAVLRVNTVAYSRKEVSNTGDRYMIELGEARVLYRTYESTGQKVLTPVRMEWLEKRYGTGAVARIRALMQKLQTGELE